ncbi:MAG: protein-L-isoaspartate(D-aspartate) O-methyltransferase [Burkholderiales bacterium]
MRWTALLLGFLPIAAAKADPAAAQREMIEDIKNLDEATRDDRPPISTKVLATMGSVPRHEFVPADQVDSAYRNRPLSIGHGQTISQPYIVALMTDLAHLDSGDTVLEVGTGSGYQAAILSQLAKKVYTIEIVEPLGREAAKRLQSYANVETKIGDGYKGWPTAGPFDAIIVTAAPDHIPPALIEQLKPGGRLVIPLGGQFSIQQLMVVEKKQDGSTTTKEIVPVRFVPLTREKQN